MGVYQWTRTVVTNVITGEKETLPINNASILEGNQDIKTASVPDRLRTIVLEIQENKISPSETEATENESSNDTKTKVGQATAAAGVAIFDLGLSMDASVVGAVPGVILNVIGGVVTGVGAAVSFWPDSEEDPSKIKVEFTPYEVRSTPKEDE
ncbi:hypothetical protein GCM10009118_24280 [Wandonia haliotis]|uniref:Uncharacterized protein n=1 Tax=Wandonia haliotis TaxID=574963 RepID=A0ABP3Y5G1_9FLAO